MKTLALALLLSSAAQATTVVCTGDAEGRTAKFEVVYQGDIPQRMRVSLDGELLADYAGELISGGSDQEGDTRLSAVFGYSEPDDPEAFLMRTEWEDGQEVVGHIAKGDVSIVVYGMACQ